MAEIWGAVAVGVVSAAGAAYQANRAGAAGAAAARGANAATAEEARQYDTTRADLAPYRVTGGGALNALARLYGLPTTTPEQFTAEQDVLMGDAYLPAGAVSDSPGNRAGSNIFLDGQLLGRVNPGGPNGRFVPAQGVDLSAIRRDRAQQAPGGASTAPGTPDLSSFFTSPDYTFRRDEGMRGLERSAASRGGAFSGNALRALAEFNSNMASGEFNNYANRLASIAGVGQTATNQTAAYGANYAANAGRNALAAGEARSSGIIGQANAIGQGANDLAGLYGYYSNRKKPPGGTWGGYTGYNPYTDG